MNRKQHLTLVQSQVQPDDIKFSLKPAFDSQKRNHSANFYGAVQFAGSSVFLVLILFLSTFSLSSAKSNQFDFSFGLSYPMGSFSENMSNGSGSADFGANVGLGYNKLFQNNYTAGLKVIFTLNELSPELVNHSLKVDSISAKNVNTGSWDSYWGLANFGYRYKLQQDKLNPDDSTFLSTKIYLGYLSCEKPKITISDSLSSRLEIPSSRGTSFACGISESVEWGHTSITMTYLTSNPSFKTKAIKYGLRSLSSEDVTVSQNVSLFIINFSFLF